MTIIMVTIDFLIFTVFYNYLITNYANTIKNYCAETLHDSSMITTTIGKIWDSASSLSNFKPIGCIVQYTA